MASSTTSGTGPERSGAGARPPERAAATLTTAELVKEITSQLGLLVRKQIELAKTELRADLRKEAFAAGNLGLAALGVLIALNLLLVTVALALALVMPAWVAGLVVSGFTLLLAGIAAAIGWRRRVRKPLSQTRRSIEDEVHWTRERMA
jgi:pilus assembly protein TadC